MTVGARLLIVGNPGEEHIGSHLLDAAWDLGCHAELLDVTTAQAGPAWRRKLFWHLMGHRPANLGRFNRQLLERCASFRPDIVLVTGIAPVMGESLRAIRRLGVATADYLTDDPWNPANSARHFWSALSQFDWIFSPRHAAIPDLRAFGCRQVEYLPFAYHPAIHFLEPPPTEEIRLRYACELAIIGGADRHRIPLAEAAIESGLAVALYGGYWNKSHECRPRWRGFVHGRELRWAASTATVNLVMGRKANRDGHAMRSYEVPAMGGAMVVEDTADHRVLFGAEGEAVLYYASVDEMIGKVRALARDSNRASVMARRARMRVTRGANTYRDRLASILERLGR